MVGGHGRCARSRVEAPVTVLAGRAHGGAAAAHMFGMTTTDRHGNAHDTVGRFAGRPPTPPEGSLAEDEPAPNLVGERPISIREVRAGTVLRLFGPQGRATVVAVDREVRQYGGDEFTFTLDDGSRIVRRADGALLTAIDG